MSNELDTHDIDRLIAQARQARSNAVGELIAQGTRHAVARTLLTLDRALHAFLMSPTVPRN
jgi:hypothetical protein